MTTAKLPPNEMPDWPRLLSRNLAAAYLGISPNMVNGLPIPPLKVQGRTLYDRKALDRWVDELTGVPKTGDSRAYLGRIAQCGT